MQRLESSPAGQIRLNKIEIEIEIKDKIEVKVRIKTQIKIKVIKDVACR